MFKYYLYKLAQFITNHVSRRTAYRIARVLSDIQYVFSFRDRRAVRNNLKVITGGEGDIEAMTRQVFRNFGKYLTDFFRMSRDLDEEFIRRHVRIRNLERMDEALRAGQGGVSVTAHLGNWELGAAIVSMIHKPPIVIALPHKERPVNDLFNAQRESRGIIVVPSSNAVRRCLEGLKENRFVAIAADRDFTGHGLTMPFLGRRMHLPKGAAILSLKTGAPVVPIFLIPEEDGRYTLTIEEPVYPPPPPQGPEAGKNGEKKVIPDEELAAFMRRYTSVIEEKIRRHPTHWLMFREFWTQ